MKIKLLLLSIAAFLQLMATSQSFGQVLTDWEDIKTGGPQLPVYVPPPAVYHDGMRTVSFTISYNGFTGEAQAAFQYASTIWSVLLNSTVPIKVNAWFVPLPAGLLGITLPNGRKNFAGAPQPDVWYATSLANAIAGTELNSGEADFDLYLNNTINWYYGIDGNGPGNKYDFVSIVLHEMCHGLGFVGLAKTDGTTGSFGLLQASDFAPIVTSFPWPALDTLPGIYDTKLEDATGTPLTSLSNPSSGLNTVFTGNQVYFNGDLAILLNGGVKPRMYAPAVFALGSSLLHLNESTYPAGNINELMTPFAGTANAVHDPGPIVMGILQDIGWSINYNVGIGNMMEEKKMIAVFPNPVHQLMHLQLPQESNVFNMHIELWDIYGKCRMRQENLPDAIDVSDLPAGHYLLLAIDGDNTYQVKFTKD